jgi:transposase
MLADQLDYVVGVDPHRDLHALAVVHVLSGAVVFEATVAANSEGYGQALKLVEVHALGRRAFAVEGTGSFGAGLTRFLSGRGCSRWAGCGGSVARAGRPTRLMLCGPLAACSPRSARRRLAPAASVRPCRR